MKHSKKISVASITIAGMLALGSVGVAGAQTDGGSSPSHAKASTASGRQVRRGAVKLAFQTAATTIGIEPSALKDAVKGGQTIGQVADANGSSAQAVVDAIVAVLGSKVDEALAAGTIDAARAAKAHVRIPAVADRFVNTLPRRLQGTSTATG